MPMVAIFFAVGWLRLTERPKLALTAPDRNLDREQQQLERRWRTRQNAEEFP